MNIRLEADSWTQATLPVSQGGLGIRLASDLALPAFVASARGSSLGAEALLPAEVAEAGYQHLAVAKERWDHFFGITPYNSSLQNPCNQKTNQCRFYGTLVYSRPNMMTFWRNKLFQWREQGYWPWQVSTPPIGLMLFQFQR